MVFIKGEKDLDLCARRHIRHDKRVVLCREKQRRKPINNEIQRAVWGRRHHHCGREGPIPGEMGLTRSRC